MTKKDIFRLTLYFIKYILYKEYKEGTGALQNKGFKDKMILRRNQTIFKRRVL